VETTAKNEELTTPKHSTKKRRVRVLTGASYSTSQALVRTIVVGLRWRRLLVRLVVRFVVRPIRPSRFASVIRFPRVFPPYFICAFISRRLVPFRAGLLRRLTLGLWLGAWLIGSRTWSWFSSPFTLFGSRSRRRCWFCAAVSLLRTRLRICAGLVPVRSRIRGCTARLGLTTWRLIWIAVRPRRSVIVRSWVVAILGPVSRGGSAILAIRRRMPWCSCLASYCHSTAIQLSRPCGGGNGRFSLVLRS
jgi:hypothetical protein